MRVDVLIIVSAVAVDLLMDALTDIGVDVLVGVNVNVFAGAMAAFEFVMPLPLEEFCC